MGSHKHTYRIFNIIVALIVIIAYFILEYFVIPEFVEDKKKGMAASYSSYALTGILCLLGVGAMVAEHFDEMAALKTPRKK
jgi:hypothetical protein